MEEGMRVGEWDKEIFLGRTSYNHHYHFHSPVPGCGSSSYETYTELLKVFPFSFWHLLCALSLCVCLFVGRTVLQFTSLVYRVTMFLSRTPMPMLAIECLRSWGQLWVSAWLVGNQCFLVTAVFVVEMVENSWQQLAKLIYLLLHYFSK